MQGDARQAFRDWLVRQLQLSRWSKPHDDPALLARQIGVQEDLLRQAMEERARAKKVERVVIEYHQLTLWIPFEIRSEWDELCAALKVKGAGLLRSIISHYLLHPVTPKHLKSCWVYRGKRYVNANETRVQVMTKITRGAQQALDEHARILSVSTSALTKGIVIDVLEGRTGRIKIVSCGDLWGDPRRYLQPELFEGTNHGQ